MIVIPQMLENQIALLKKCLAFYAEDINYQKTLADGKSQLDLDAGFLAKETLKTVAVLEQQNLQISNEFEKYNETANQPTIESIMAEVKKITNQE